MAKNILRALLGLALGTVGAFAIIPLFLKDPPSGSNAEDFWEYNAMLGWKNRASLEATFEAPALSVRTAIKINSRGLRDREFPFEKAPGVKRILLIGDSYPAGFEVAMENHLKTLLERLFSNATRVEVINAGVRGYGTDQSLLYLASEGIRYQPDAVIYFFTGNDPEDNIVYHRAHRKYGKGAYIPIAAGAALTGVPVPQKFEPNSVWKTTNQAADSFFNNRELAQRNARILERSRSAFEDVLARVGETVHGEQPEMKVPQPIVDFEWTVTTTVLKLLASFSRSNNLPVFVYEVSPGHFSAQPAARIEKAAQEAGLPLIVSRYVFAKESGVSRKLCYATDLHWNERGHALAAQVIYDYFVEHKVLHRE
jgi:hypothetical protein